MADTNIAIVLVKKLQFSQNYQTIQNSCLSKHNWSSSSVIPPCRYLNPCHLSCLSPITRLKQNVSLFLGHFQRRRPFMKHLQYEDIWIKKQMKNLLAVKRICLSWPHQFTFFFLLQPLSAISLCRDPIPVPWVGKEWGVWVKEIGKVKGAAPNTHVHANIPLEAPREMLIVLLKFKIMKYTFFRGNSAIMWETREKNIKSEALRASFLIGRDGQAAWVFHWLWEEDTSSDLDGQCLVHLYPHVLNAS